MCFENNECIARRHWCTLRSNVQPGLRAPRPCYYNNLSDRAHIWWMVGKYRPLWLEDALVRLMGVKIKSCYFLNFPQITPQGQPRSFLFYQWYFFPIICFYLYLVFSWRFFHSIGLWVDWERGWGRLLEFFKVTITTLYPFEF